MERKIIRLPTEHQTEGGANGGDRVRDLIITPDGTIIYDGNKILGCTEIHVKITPEDIEAMLCVLVNGLNIQYPITEKE